MEDQLQTQVQNQEGQINNQNQDQSGLFLGGYDKGANSLDIDQRDHTSVWHPVLRKSRGKFGSMTKIVYALFAFQKFCRRDGFRDGTVCGFPADPARPPLGSVFPFKPIRNLKRKRC